MPDVPEDCESPTSEARIMTTLMQKIERWLWAARGHPLCNQHVILIDDASSFGVCEWYPTLDEVRQMAERNWMAMEVRDDIIRIKAVE